MKNSPEAAEQAALFEWAALSEQSIPELALMYHVPNEGKRSPRSGAEQKRIGLKRGVPDVCLPVPSNGFHGMYIEMKAGRNRPTKEQTEYLRRLAAAGYYCVICWSWAAAVKCITAYLRVACPALISETKDKWEVVG
ncbi:MAG: VRR-NUC domain-containing protein [Bacillota bacterium]|jgi:hypothetical protein